VTGIAPEPAGRAVARILAGGFDDSPRIRHVTQTILAGNPDGIPGNCVQAAVASLLDMDLGDVPHFAVIGGWLEWLCTWAALNGWLILRHNPGYRARMAIASGPSPRGVQHAVVMLDGGIAWDPHPSRDGLVSVSDIWEFSRADPADPVFLLRLDNAAYVFAELGVPPP
jgi:hypothetical protein